MQENIKEFLHKCSSNNCQKPVSSLDYLKENILCSFNWDVFENNTFEAKAKASAFQGQGQDQYPVA